VIISPGAFSGMSENNLSDERFCAIVKFNGIASKFPKWKQSVIMWFTLKACEDLLEAKSAGSLSHRRDTFGIIKSMSLPIDDEADEEQKSIDAANAKIAAEKSAKQKLIDRAIMQRNMKCFYWIWSSLSDSLQDLFTHITLGNTYALYKAICEKYQSASVNNQQQVRRLLYADKLAVNEDMNVYISRMVGYSLQLIELKSPMAEPDFIYHFYRGLPESYDDFVANLQSLDEIEFTSLCRRLVDYQNNKRVRQTTINDSARAAHHTSTSTSAICFACGKSGHRSSTCEVVPHTLKCSMVGCTDTAGHNKAGHEARAAFNKRKTSGDRRVAFTT
jgi:hypothetical protein